MTAVECFFVFLNNNVIFFSFKHLFKVALIEAKILISKPIPEITHGATYQFLSSWTTLEYLLLEHSVTRLNKSTQQITLGHVEYLFKNHMW